MSQFNVFQAPKSEGVIYHVARTILRLRRFMLQTLTVPGKCTCARMFDSTHVNA